VTGRSHTQDAIGKRLSGRVTAIPMTPKRRDIIRYLHARLDEDTTLDTMEINEGADIV